MRDVRVSVFLVEAREEFAERDVDVVRLNGLSVGFADEEPVRRPGFLVLSPDHATVEVVVIQCAEVSLQYPGKVSGKLELVGFLGFWRRPFLG